MRVLISVDMEGVTGVSSWVQVTPPEYGVAPYSTAEYERARLRMTREAAAATAGALEGGALEVIVNDSHNGMRNLIPEELHPEARWISGNDKELGMVQGLQDGVDALLFVGYHARAGSVGGPLAHTWNGHVQDVRVGGVSTGEYGINALVAGDWGVPVAFVSGDELAVEQVREQLGADIVGVAVKRGYSTYSAVHLHPERAQALIREGVREALGRLGRLKPWRLEGETRVEVDFDHEACADQCAPIPGTERVGPRTVAFSASSGVELFQKFRIVANTGDIKLHK
ncbi:D-amino peptidase [Deinobacterium chartae]|uniref:D-amino peptidase n=1 Tax=Deinobacterium chartae TaxID=521158 RepID=A0A841I366_9DEIO|nr:M55 family metallopeptidase [Deinobacterium chartae]MBB6098860.1 D-amino peptidase [Deinobacterium chartae]